MQEKNMVNCNELIERGRKLHSQAVFEAFYRVMILMKICPGKRTTSARVSLAKEQQALIG